MINRISLTVLTILALGAQHLNAQQTICLGDDATVCVGSTITIQDCNPGNNAGLLLDNPTWVNLSDDSYSGIVPIGFSFDFYGSTKTQCVIGSNGVIGFDLANANGYCAWGLTGVAPLPNPGFIYAQDAQMPAYHDINPSAFASPNGEIMYQTIGTAPNRQFVVLWKDIYAFGGGGECTYMGVIMNETANSFEFHIGYKPVAAGWNGGLAIQGSQNAPGTIAHPTPGRNNQVWTAAQEAKIWTPTSPANTMDYTISNIPYLLILSPNSTFQWENTLGFTYPYNNGDLVVNPVLPGTKGYFLSAASTSCNIGAGAASDTSWITGVSSAVSASAIDDICSAGIGEVTATPLAGIPPYTFNWPGLGNASTQTVTGVSAGNYTVEMWDGNGCMSIANVIVGDTPAAFQGTTTIISCPGGNDGTAFAEMVPPLGNITYLWDDPAAQTTQTATGLTVGQYTCTITSDIGCSGTVVLDVTEIPGMIGNIVNQTDVTCNSGNDGMIEVNVIQGTPPYTYSWDNSSSNSNIANDLMVGPHTVTVTDANGCIITISGVLGQPSPLSITFITPDTQICPEHEIELSATGTGGSSPYTFTWFENGTLVGTGDMITVDPEVTNTQYCVELSETCGSPTDQECTLIYFPTPIEPSAEPIDAKLCVPNTFEFNNTSVNGGEIATTFWEFGDNITHVITELGNDSTSHYYTAVGNHDITMTVTSIYGCVYTDTMFSLIEVLPSPTADFNFSSNPATIFETSIFMQDKSSYNTIDWQWFSPGSEPSTSSSVNPIFLFPDGVVATYPITLVVTTEHGCVDTTTLYLNVVEDILFFAPNAFTPDGDEHNQSWKPEIQGIDIHDYEILIYNRWGELVWESHDVSVGWDGTYMGKLVQAGVYQWVARVKSPYNDNKETFTGSVSILK